MAVPRVGASPEAPTKPSFCFSLDPLGRAEGWPGILTLAMVRFRHLPSGGTSRCEGWVFSDAAKLTDFNRSRDSGFSFSQYLYTIMLSNIRVENTVQYGERNSLKGAVIFGHAPAGSARLYCLG